MITLDMLLPGQSAEIVRVSGVDGIAIRLREMGFIPGEGVHCYAWRPWGIR